MTTANVGTYLPNIQDKRKFGLDFSSNQGMVNFAKLAKPEGFPKIEFLAMRTGISWAYKDSFFETYWNSTKSILSIPRLAYHVLYPRENIKIQVDNMKSRFPGGVFDGHGVVNDMELVHLASRSQLSEACYEFTNRLRDWAKKPVFIYTRYGFILDYMDYWSSKYVSWMKDQLWWMANYYGLDNNGNPILAEFPTNSIKVPPALKSLKLAIHQTGAKGDGWKVGTVSRQVDTNRWCLSDTEYQDLFGINQEQPEPVDDAEKLSRLWNAHPELHQL